MSTEADLREILQLAVGLAKDQTYQSMESSVDVEERKAALLAMLVHHLERIAAALERLTATDE